MLKIQIFWNWNVFICWYLFFLFSWLEFIRFFESLFLFPFSKLKNRKLVKHFSQSLTCLNVHHCVYGSPLTPRLKQTWEGSRRTCLTVTVPRQSHMHRKPTTANIQLLHSPTQTASAVRSQWKRLREASHRSTVHSSSDTCLHFDACFSLQTVGSADLMLNVTAWCVIVNFLLFYKHWMLQVYLLI